MRGPWLNFDMALVFANQLDLISAVPASVLWSHLTLFNPSSNSCKKVATLRLRLKNRVQPMLDVMLSLTKPILLLLSCYKCDTFFVLTGLSLS